MPAKITPDLNAQYQRFAGLLAVGYTQVDAYNNCFKTKGRKPEQIAQSASKLARNEHIQAYARRIIDDLKLSDVDTANKAIIALLQDIDACRAAGKYAALAAFTRLRLQVHGLLKENINITDEQRLSDDQLIERLAGKDKSKADLIKSMLAPVQGFKRA